MIGVWRVLNASDDDLSDYPNISQVLNGSVCMYVCIATPACAVMQ